MEQTFEDQAFVKKVSPVDGSETILAVHEPLRERLRAGDPTLIPVTDKQAHAWLDKNRKQRDLTILEKHGMTEENLKEEKKESKKEEAREKRVVQTFEDRLEKALTYNAIELLALKECGFNGDMDRKKTIPQLKKWITTLHSNYKKEVEDAFKSDRVA